MRRIAAGLSLVLVLGFGAGVSGCADKKEAQCKEAYGKVMEAAKGMMKALGKAAEADKLNTPEAQAKFVAKCKELPDEVIACIDLAKAKDPACRELMKKHKDAIPMPGK
jgi:hypothetical protein